MIPNDPIDRRTALRSAVALGASGTLLLLRDFDAIASPLPTCDRPEDIASQLWSIRAGSGLGPISLGLRQQQVVDVLGAPQDTLDFPGATIEELRKALGDLYDPERHSAVAPRFFLKYLDMGVSVEIMEGTRGANPMPEKRPLQYRVC